MKKTTFLILSLMVSIGLTAQTMQGTYKVGTAEGNNYASLSTAVADLKTNGIAGDVILEITSNITEDANIGLGVNTNGHSITIRPDQDADRIITFTKVADNTSPSGHFIIGYTDPASGWNDANTIATNNVTIDGYAEGGTTKRLKFTTASGALLGSRIIVVLGGSQNTTIKNCIIESKSWGASATCVAIVPRKGTAIEVAATNVTIENNTLLSKASGTGQGIACINSGTLTTAKIQGFVAKNNIIEAPGRCLWIQHTTGGEISGNTVKLAQTLSPGTINYVLWFGTGVAGNFNVYDNQFLQSLTNEATASGTLGIRTISCASGATYEIYNNVFTGLNKVKPATATVNLTYIFFGGTGNIRHNTFYMPKLTDVTSPGYYQAITLSFANPVITNNIFISNEDAIVNRFYSALSTANINNNIYFLKAGTTNAKIVADLSDFTAYQTANPTKDVNSVYKDVAFTSETDLSLAGTSVGDESLGVPHIATLNKDILGADRNARFTYAGAYQAALPTKTFTVTVPNGTEDVYIWGDFLEKEWNTNTPYQLTATANENEFTGTFAALDNVLYRYMNGADIDYSEGKYENGVLELSHDNKTFNIGTTDNVEVWYNMPSVQLSTTFATDMETTPGKLFVKTSMDNFASSTELTKNLARSSNTTFTTTLTNAENKIKGDVEYKYYTTEPENIGENYETDANGTVIVRKTSAPKMTDEITHFQSLLVVSINESEANDIQIRHTENGIEVDLEKQALVELYTINGALVDRTTTSGTYVRNLEKDIYLIAINGKAIKFVK